MKCNSSRACAVKAILPACRVSRQFINLRHRNVRTSTWTALVATVTKRGRAFISCSVRCVSPCHWSYITGVRIYAAYTAILVSNWAMIVSHSLGGHVIGNDRVRQCARISRTVRARLLLLMMTAVSHHLAPKHLAYESMDSFVFWSGWRTASRLSADDISRASIHTTTTIGSGMGNEKVHLEMFFFAQEPSRPVYLFNPHVKSK
jgi:hypothetical protein